MSRKRERHGWIYLRGDQFVCERCGGTHRPVLPMEIDAFVAVSRAFMALHKHCPEKRT